MRRRCTCIVGLVLAAALLSAAVPARADKWAVVVGISHYQDGSIPDLRFAAEDARAVRDLLVDPDVGGVPAGHVLLLTEEQGTRAAIIEAIAVWLGDPTRVHPDDQVLIFFSGHGATDLDAGERYLLPADAERDKLIASAWAMHHVHEALRRIEARQVIVLLDACHAGSVGVVPSGQEKRVVVEAARPLGSALATGEGRVLIASCRGDETSFEDPAAGHGAFTASLLQGLGGEADSDADEQVTLGEIYSYLNERVPARTSGRQHPMQKGEVSGTLVLTSVGTTKKRLRRLAHLEHTGELATDEARGIRVLLRQTTPEAKLAKLLLDGDLTVAEHRQAQVIRSRKEWQRSDREKAIGQFLDMLLAGDMTPQAYRAAVAAIEQAVARPRPTPTPQPVPAPTEPAVPSPAPSPPAYRPPTAGATGILYVDSDPQGHDVYVDGALAGKTPLTLPDVGVGEHEVEVRSPFHHDDRETTVVEAGQVTRLAPQLEQATGTLVVTTDLPDAQVEVDGTVLSLSDGRGQRTLVAGEHEVKVTWGDNQWSLARKVPVPKDQQVSQSLLAAQVSGNLTILSPEPVTGLSVDGNAVAGETPLTVRQVPVGRHVISAARYGDKGLLSGRLSLHVEPDQSVIANLEPRWLLWPRLPLRVLTGHKGPIKSVAFSPDGRLLASAAHGEYAVRLWSSATGQCVRRLQHDFAVGAVAFAPDGHTLASVALDNTWNLWDVNAGRRLLRLQSSHGFASVAFSHDGNHIAVSSGDSTVAVYDARTGNRLRVLSGHRWPAYALAFDHGSTLLASGSGDCTVRFWDLGSGRCVGTLSEHTRSVSSVAFSSDKALFASGSRDGTVRLWDVGSGCCRRILEVGHASPDNAVLVSFNTDSRVLASGAKLDNVVKLWDTTTGRCLHVLDADSGVTGLAVSLDGRLLAAGSADGTIKLWQMPGLWEEAE